ncbi:MAG TPA: lipocalin-like domain-containing protein [Usitatibacter sp.]|nr:lipocalin-like domain-containing protein [Usitatibacter sp.]
MNRSNLTFATLMLATALSLPLASAAQSLGKSLSGTSWSLVSADMVDPKGAKRGLVEGKNSKGSLIFTANGRYAYLVIADMPKFAGDRVVPTPAEEKMVARGLLTNFGTYSVDDATSTLTLKIERSSYPTQNGTSGKRKVTLKGDELVMENEARTKGGTTKVVWKKN